MSCKWKILIDVKYNGQIFFTTISWYIIFEIHVFNHIRYLKKQFQKADKNKNGSLTFDECLGLTEQLNIQMDKKNLLEFFQVRRIQFVKYQISNQCFNVYSVLNFLFSHFFHSRQPTRIRQRKEKRKLLTSLNSSHFTTAFFDVQN